MHSVTKSLTTQKVFQTYTEPQLTYKYPEQIHPVSLFTRWAGMLVSLLPFSPNLHVPGKGANRIQSAPKLHRLCNRHLQASHKVTYEQKHAKPRDKPQRSTCKNLGSLPLPPPKLKAIQLSQKIKKNKETKNKTKSWSGLSSTYFQWIYQTFKGQNYMVHSSVDLCIFPPFPPPPSSFLV